MSVSMEQKVNDEIIVKLEEETENPIKITNEMNYNSLDIKKGIIIITSHKKLFKI